MEIIPQAPEVMCADSMHWNRTIHTSVLDKVRVEGREKPESLPKEVVESVRKAIQAEIAKSKDELRLINLEVKAEIGPVDKKPDAG